MELPTWLRNGLPLVLLCALLAGCSGGFSAGDDDDGDGDTDVEGGGEVNVDDEDDDEKDSPGAALWAGIGVLAAAALVMRARRT